MTTPPTPWPKPLAAAQSRVAMSHAPAPGVPTAVRLRTWWHRRAHPGHHSALSVEARRIVCTSCTFREEWRP